MAFLGEAAVAGEMSVEMGLGDVPQFLAGHVGLVEGDGEVHGGASWLISAGAVLR